MRPNFFQNSEIQKYYWQTFSLQRLIAMPLIIFTVSALIYMTGIAAFEQYDTPLTQMYQNLANAAYAGFYIIVILWGGYQAATAIVQEIKENTWDNLRLSPISPWDLTIGKVFGSTLYNWYGGLMLLAIYAFAISNAAPNHQPFYQMLLLFGTGLFTHLCGIFISLLPLRVHTGREQFHVIGYFILSLIASSFFLQTGGAASFASNNWGITWFGESFSPLPFILGLLFSLSLWAFLGIYRFMRDALKFKNTPIVWSLFVLFVMIYYGGFTPTTATAWEVTHAPPLGANQGNGIFFSIYIIGLTLCYLASFSENLNIIRYRALFHHLRAKNWEKLFHLIPTWFVTVCITLMAGLLFLLVSATPHYLTGEILFFIISSLLFMARDIAMLHYFTLVPNGKQPLLATLFYAGILYFLLPSLLSLISKVHGYFFYPSYSFVTQGSVFTVLPVIVECLIAFWLLKRRYQAINTTFQ